MTEKRKVEVSLEQYLKERGNKIADDQVFGDFFGRFASEISETASELDRWNFLKDNRDLPSQELMLLVNRKPFNFFNTIFNPDQLGVTLSRMLSRLPAGDGVDCRLPSYFFAAACQQANIQVGIWHFTDSLHPHVILPGKNMDVSFHPGQNEIETMSNEKTEKILGSNQYSEDLLWAMQLGDLISISRNVQRSDLGVAIAPQLASMSLQILGGKVDFVVNLGMGVVRGDDPINHLRLME